MSGDNLRSSESGKGKSTLADVARSAGFSKSTVSLALRGDPRVLPETREVILKCARSLGYHPHPALSSLSAYRWNKEKLNRSGVAYVVGARQSDWTFSESEYFIGASRAATHLGYHLEAFSLKDYPSIAAAERVLYARGIHGLLIAPTLHSRHSFSITWEKYCAIACGLGWDIFPLDTVIPDVYNSLREAVAKVLAAGYRRLGLALMFQNKPSLNDQYRYAAALVEQQLCLRQPNNPHPYSINILVGQRSDIAEMRDWLQSGQFDVVLGLSDGVASMITDSGFQIPAGLAFASLHKTDTTTHIAGIDCDRQGIGEAAMRLLDLQMRNNQTGARLRPSIQMIRSIWIPGASLPLRPPAVEPVR